MLEIIWEYVVQEQAVGRFELAYGPGGAWSQLFAGRAGFRGITVLRDARNPMRYLIVEVWDTDAQREQALDECVAQHADLQASLGEWTESAIQVGTFSVLAAASVRPRGGRRGRRGSESGERGRRAPR